MQGASLPSAFALNPAAALRGQALRQASGALSSGATMVPLLDLQTTSSTQQVQASSGPPSHQPNAAPQHPSAASQLPQRQQPMGNMDRLVALLVNDARFSAAVQSCSTPQVAAAAIDVMKAHMPVFVSTLSRQPPPGPTGTYAIAQPTTSMVPQPINTAPSPLAPSASLLESASPTKRALEGDVPSRSQGRRDAGVRRGEMSRELKPGELVKITHGNKRTADHIVGQFAKVVSVETNGWVNCQLVTTNETVRLQQRYLAAAATAAATAATPAAVTTTAAGPLGPPPTVVPAPTSATTIPTPAGGLAGVVPHGLVPVPGGVAAAGGSAGPPLVAGGDMAAPPVPMPTPFADAGEAGGSNRAPSIAASSLPPPPASGPAVTPLANSVQPGLPPLPPPPIAVGPIPTSQQHQSTSSPMASGPRPTLHEKRMPQLVGRGVTKMREVVRILRREVLSLEEEIPWNAVNESRWRSSRTSWRRAVKNAETVTDLAVKLGDLHDNLKTDKTHGLFQKDGTWHRSLQDCIQGKAHYQTLQSVWSEWRMAVQEWLRNRAQNLPPPSDTLSAANAARAAAALDVAALFGSDYVEQVPLELILNHQRESFLVLKSMVETERARVAAKIEILSSDVSSEASVPAVTDPHLAASLLSMLQHNSEIKGVVGLSHWKGAMSDLDTDMDAGSDATDLDDSDMGPLEGEG